MRTRTTTEIVIETLSGERRRRVWRPRDGGEFVIVVNGVSVARVTMRKHKRVGGSRPERLDDARPSRVR